MTKYKTAKQLGILPEERTALIAFASAPALGRTIALNGRAHYYDQGHAQDGEQAEENHCGTAGCVAGFVFAHARYVQGKRKLRGATNADDYISAAGDIAHHSVPDEICARPDDKNWKPTVPLLYELYSEGSERKLPEAQRVVAGMLRTGRVRWSP